MARPGSLMAAGQVQGGARRPNTLLLVDDERQVCEGLRRILRPDGYEIHVANDAEEALRILARHAVDVIVSDQRMPRKKGTELLREVQSRYPDTVRMILSGAADVDEVAQAMGSGAIYKFLTKPIDPALLRANVREAFSRAASLRPVDNGATDPVTGFLTRAGLEKRLPDIAARARAEGETVCLLMLELDQYDSAVSSFGRSFAQGFLQTFASELARVQTRGDVIAHEAAGSFLLVTSARDPVARITRIDETIDDILARPIVASGRPITATLSIGATANEGGETFNGLVDQAHAAMMASRERGGATIQLYQPHLVAAFRGQLELESELRQVVAAKTLELHYQPQVDVTTGRIIGLEALLRWRHPVHGFVSPARFIPLAERHGLIREIGAWVLEEAVREFAAWGRVGIAPEELAINVSARQMKDASFVAAVAEVIKKRRVAARRLVLEITESAAIEQSEAISACLEGLGRLGVTLAIDDFGTGYANLGNLTRSLFTKLKIDRSLLPRDDRGNRLYANVVSMAHGLEMTTVAEGVETASELAAIRAAGCTIVQGYLYSAPLAPAKLVRLLEDGAFPAVRG